MRKIACLILLLADIALSCEVVAMSSHDYPIVEINLFDENKVDMGKVKSVDYGNGLLKEEKTFLAYRADLDTSVYVYLNGKQMKFYKMCHSAQECDSLYEDYDFAKVISDEMHKMGSRGLFVREFDVDSLSRHILDVMLSESYNDFTLSGISYNYDRSYSDEDDHDADAAWAEEIALRAGRAPFNVRRLKSAPFKKHFARSVAPGWTGGIFLLYPKRIQNKLFFIFS